MYSPQWIAKMYPGKVGRDHLGLGSVSSDQILPTLSPSINVLTFHPRYHSFYIFLLDEFWRRDRPRSYSAWKQFYRPREFIFSVGANMCQRPEHANLRSIVGGQKTGPLATANLEAYDTSYEYIDSPFGGYGLYYFSVMLELGLILPGGRGLPIPIEVPTEKGKNIAEAFRQAVISTEYYKNYFDDDHTLVPRNVIQEYIHKACLCQLQTETAEDRKTLQDLFLHGGLDHLAASRRGTFRLLLDIADQTVGQSIDQDQFRQIIYFKKTEAGISYNPKNSVKPTFLKWRLYQAREYFAFALNVLWSHLYDWGIGNNGDIRPLQLSDFWYHLDRSINYSDLANLLGLPDPRITSNSGMLELFNWVLGTIGEIAERFDDLSSIDSQVNENRLYQLAYSHRSSPQVVIAGMLLMLVLIKLRFGYPKLWMQPEWVISKMGDNGRLSVDGFLRTFQNKLESGPITIREIIKWIYSDYIILQHLMVANNKLPENTFRFQREGQSLRFFNLGAGFSFMDSRFYSISTTIHELGFCGNFSQSNHGLTKAGYKLLTQGDIE